MKFFVKKFVLIGILLSVLLISGCIKEQTKPLPAIPPASSNFTISNVSDNVSISSIFNEDIASMNSTIEELNETSFDDLISSEFEGGFE